MYNIYKITNLVNNKIYIGQTTRDIKDRFISHIYSSNNTLLKVAIEKYGIKNFKIELLESTDCKNTADNLEEKYVKLFKSYINTHGYNNTNSGKVGSPIQNNGFIILQKSIYFDNVVNNFSKIELGYFLILLLSIDNNSGKIKYGNNASQYCRTIKDLSKVLKVSYETLRKGFIKKLKTYNIINEKNNILYINPAYVILNNSLNTELYDIFKSDIDKYEILTEHI